MTATANLRRFSETRRRSIIAAAALAAAPSLVFGQSPVSAKAIRVVSTPSSAPRRVAFFSVQGLDIVATRVEAFRGRLARQGFVEGRTLEVRFFRPDEGAQGMEDAIRAMLAWRPEVIHAAFSNVISEIRKATDEIPIVYRAVGDPVALGFIASYARPGGNITGVSSPGHVLMDKLLELWREVLPNARRLAIVHSGLAVPGRLQVFGMVLDSALQRGFDCTQIELSGDSTGLQGALQRALSSKAELLLPYDLASVRGPVYPVLIDFEKRHRVPVLFTTAEVAREGALLGYGFEVLDAILMAADMVAAILKGANPAELPAQIASRIELAVNLRTAEELGIRFPRSVLLRADQVVQ